MAPEAADTPRTPTPEPRAAIVEILARAIVADLRAAADQARPPHAAPPTRRERAA